jgi:TPR repeat protein
LVLGVVATGLGGLMKNEKEAVEYFRRAANLHFAPALYNLGRCYRNGEGVPLDQRQAMSYYLLAAQQNYASASVEIGELFESGTCVCFPLPHSHLPLIISPID